MKKVFFLAALFAAVTINATDLWTGSKNVSWGDGLQIAASEFAGAQPGQKIVMHYLNATDGVEFKVLNTNSDHLAGSREAAWIDGDGTFEQFLTQSAVDSIKLYGLEIIGANFTVTKVELLDGKVLKEGITVWTGYFWVDNTGGWKTLELYFDAYKGIDFSNIDAVRFYTEAAGTDFILNFMKGWDPGDKFADQTNMTDGEGYKELPLTDDLRTQLKEAGHWMVQMSHEALSPFNATDIVLVPKGVTPTAIEKVKVGGNAVKCFKNGQLIIVQGNKTFNMLGAEL